MRPLMRRSVSPKPMVMLVLAAVSVELPPFITFLLVRWSQHFGPIWMNWPMLDGLFPLFVVLTILKQMKLHGGMIFFWLICGGFTLGLISLVFALSWRSSYWRRYLGAGLAFSTVLAFLATMILRA